MQVGNLAYMCRMGLWGPGTAFGNFDEFLASMKTRGVPFLEMLAMELKAEGKYVARGLSFLQAEVRCCARARCKHSLPPRFKCTLLLLQFMEVEAPLNAQQVAMYDAAAAVWTKLQARLAAALTLCGISKADVWKARGA
jgi:hypothetical protein